MQLRLHLHIKSLRGHVYAWVPPPPGDRLWFSFVEPPELHAVATPMVRRTGVTVMLLPVKRGSLGLRWASATPLELQAVAMPMVRRTGQRRHRRCSSQ